MGLDIYLYRYDDFKKTKELEDKYNDFSNKSWDEAGEYDSLTKEQKDEIGQKIKDYAISLGLDEWGSDETTRWEIQEQHPLYPNHYFKIGYFRSSYNDSGIERILRNFGLPTMSDIFNHEEGGLLFPTKLGRILGTMRRSNPNAHRKGVISCSPCFE